MFFRTEICLIKFKALQAVDDGGTVILVNSDKSVSYSERGRTSRCIFRNKGSMTVEAALVFPIFLLAVTAFLYLLVLTQLKIETGGSLTDAGKDLAVLAEYSDTAGGMGSTASGYTIWKTGGKGSSLRESGGCCLKGRSGWTISAWKQLGSGKVPDYSGNLRTGCIPAGNFMVSSGSDSAETGSTGLDRLWRTGTVVE